MSAEQLVRALAVSWSTNQLYPDPTIVPAFQQAVSRLGELATEGVTLTVGLDGFLDGDEIIEINQAAADRLAHALFGHNIENLAVVGEPSPEETCSFFAAIDRTPDEVDNDLVAYLASRGVSAFRVKPREALQDHDGSAEQPIELEQDARNPLVAALFEDLDAANRIAAEIVAEAEEDIAAVGPIFERRYLEVYGTVDETDWVGHERTVQTFVEAFFALPTEARVAVLEVALERRDERPFANFLDQFAASELADLAPHLADSSLELLLDYARVVSEEEFQRTELIDLIDLGAGIGEAKSAVATRVGERLADVQSFRVEGIDAMDRLNEQIAIDGQPVEHGVIVASALFEVEQRDHRRQRLMRVWAGKVINAIQNDQFNRALEWLKHVDDMPISDDEIDELLEQVATDEVLQVVARVVDEPGGRELIELFARQSAGRIVGLMAEEADQSRRRLLVDVVTGLAKVDVSKVSPALKDHRWYAVRNVVLALGNTRDEACFGPLVDSLHHEDHRVRAETMRALVRCGGERAIAYLVEMLTDKHERVRIAAADLLLAFEASHARRAIVDVALNDQLDANVRVSAIRHLSKVGTPAASAALERLAGTKSLFSPSLRTVKQAARESLEAA